MRIDLHTHSTSSDGTDSPAELMAAAARAGLDVVAITDHDTTGGWSAADAARPDGVTLVRGMEMSCVGPGEGLGERSDGGFNTSEPVPVHLLAYLFDPADVVFAAERVRLRDERVARVRAMADRMVADGLPIDPDAILAGAEVAGRPHLARALLEAGVVASVSEAFTRLLGTGGPYYVEKVDTPLAAAVAMVAAAGGVTVLAHARARARGRLLDLACLPELIAAGLTGLEVDHPDHTVADRALLGELADRHDLVRTGSSDYHGRNKTIELGECLTEPDQFERLVSKSSGVPLIF